MRAGQFRERVEFFAPKEERTTSGSLKVEYEKVWECRAHVVRFSNTTDKDRQEAGEAFFGSFGVIRTRNYPAIKDDQRVLMRGVWYQIILLLPPRSDNTLEINITKINE